LSRQRARGTERRTCVRSIGVLGALAALAFSSFAFPALAAAQPIDARWAAQHRPAPGPARAIGSTTRGCLQGGVALGIQGPGWEVIRPSRRRHHGHPALVEYLRDLAARARRQKLPRLLIGDLAHPRGGPTLSGHRSHQSGLDVDLWYAPGVSLGSRALTASERETLPMLPVVDLAKGTLTPAWNARIILTLAAAADDPRVDRIFVNPVVKRALCDALPKQTGWLRLMRPWWGHHDHFHVRLRCPPGSDGCESQEPLAADSGCAGLSWWFSEAARIARAKRTETPDGGPPVPPPLPAACEALLTTP